MPIVVHRRVTRWASILIFITVALGGMVCATDSSSACPAWPVCYSDQVGPGIQVGWLENPVIEFIHRLISFTALVLLGVSGWLGRRSRDPRLRVYPWVALACAVGSAVFGMMIILFTLPLALGLLDLLFALIAMALSTITHSALRSTRPDDDAPRTRKLAGVTLGWLFAMHLLGSVVAGTTTDGTGSFTRCLSWPLWELHEIDRFPALQVLRIAMAAVAIVFIAVILYLAASRPSLRTAAAVAGVALVVELGLGIVITTAGLAPTQTNGIDATIAVTYSAAAVTLMWALAWLVGQATPAAIQEPTLLESGSPTA
ncbi:cytochrome c oxidase assembly protein subunit 15 [Tessaracoccus bendigoensis DSM 12906]|uniref:Cytochrome c oxidase assembly protein subunit 15 n=1 Tax=Tessaracoccus bendigoensis DSM 12906 TaxID=1123357 RepID=A0A1M6E4T5_9ACTN|nr:cytochrome c oxidase assembly protein subunit 15 [Tessaracoccus bendigoensis DSM 12906]